MDSELRARIVRKMENRDRCLTIMESMNKGDTKRLAVILEMVGSISDWPVSFMEKLVSPHLTYMSRWHFSLFVLGNECCPLAFAEYVKFRGCLRDQSACDHIADIIMKHKMGLLWHFKTFMLPHRVSVDKPVYLRKHRWDGVGDPVPRNSPIEVFLHPVITPGNMEQEGWRWDQAYKLLTDRNAQHHFYTLPDPIVKIVPVQDPDDLGDDEFGCVRMDEYGMPLDTYLASHMDMQVALNESAPPFNRSHTVKHSMDDLLK